MRGKFGIVFLVFFLSLYSCRAQQPGHDFYEGLKRKHENNQAEAAALFVKALDNINPRVAAAAAAELMSLRLAGAEISADTMGKIRQKVNVAANGGDTDSWSQAFDALDDISFAAEKIIALLLSGGRNRFQDEAALYALGEWHSVLEDGSVLFSDAESAAINGRVAVSRLRYNEALVFFRIALRDSPGLFLHYPDLLVDLGRAFLYTDSGREGIDQFLVWENILARGDEYPPANLRFENSAKETGEENLVRFLLLFYAARIARQRGVQSTELFARALPFAPDTPEEQADACIWYILDNALASGPSAAISQLETYVPYWRDDRYFSDIMDRLTRELLLSRRWNDIIHIFALIRNRSGPITAQYAWIIGRALEEGLLSPEEILRAQRILSLASPSITAETPAKAYFRLALNTNTRASYYRFLSAAALDEPFLTFEKTPSRERDNTAVSKGGESETMRFLLGFFEHNAGEFATRFIRAEENYLSTDELRRLAESLSKAGQYQESIRLVLLYTRRDGYQVLQSDLELSHPLPYRELVEQYAGETDIEPALLFGLIRTESAFNSSAVSRAGAVGLTQLMPATAKEEADRIRRRSGPNYQNENGDITADLYNPAINIHIGASYLAFLNGRMGDPLLALLAYNGGMNRIRRWRETSNRIAGASVSLPADLFLETADFAETRNYGKSVIAAAAVYRELYYK